MEKEVTKDLDQKNRLKIGPRLGNLPRAGGGSMYTSSTKWNDSILVCGSGASIRGPGQLFEPET